MTSRPVVSVYKNDSQAAEGSVPMPGVFNAPIRNDLVHFVHSNLAKNRRQGHAVFFKAGQEHSAESWGTGRAVARIPRISGSGTSRSGQATFGNMCRKARMFAPLKIWRKWHRKVNITQRRHAVAAALAASAVTPLVMARGHSVANVPELPLVIGGLTEEQLTTKALLSALNNHGCGDDLLRVRRSKNTRAGVGKYRNTRYVMRKGPLVVFGDESQGVRNAARNLPGVDTCHVNRLNVLQLAPGGHLGRFVVFTQDAFRGLNHVFGSHTRTSQQKSNYTLNRGVMNCADLARIINSDQVQSKLRETRTSQRAHFKSRKNPLTNQAQRNRLDPFNKERIAANQASADALHKGLAAKLKAKRSKAGRAAKHARNVRDQALHSGLEASYKAAQDILDEEARLGNYQPGDTSEEED